MSVIKGGTAPAGDPSLQAERREVRRSIGLGAKFDRPFVVMNALATIVAVYGLLLNSAAVVIGAMIIAMLLGPIMGLALGMVDGDTKLLKQALVAEILGACLVLALAFLLGRIHADLRLTAEILARTKPNLLDLVIALAGGAAGAYATVSPRISVGLVGVAISTALVPPLAACGICLARGLYDLAGGAFILFLTNLVAIQCASSAVLFGFGFHEMTSRDPEDKSYLRRLTADALFFLALVIFLYTRLASSVSQQLFEDKVKAVLGDALRKIPGAYLSDTRFAQVGDRDVIVAVVTVPNSVTPEQTAKIQSLLPTRGSHKLELHVRSLLTKETTEEGYLHELSPSAPPIDVPTATRQPGQGNQDAATGAGADSAGSSVPTGSDEGAH